MNEGYSQRQTASLANTTTPTIRLWLKKHGIKWRNISESLLEQSEEVSKRAKKVWADPAKRKKQSETMKRVQSTRKKELSVSAKKNWANNRDVIVAGIRSVAHSQQRLDKLSESGKLLWQNEQYRSTVLSQRKNFDNQDYRNKISESLKGPKISTEEYIEHAQKTWGDAFDYSPTEFIGSCDKIELKCNTCNNHFWQSPRDHIKYGNCRHCNMSSGQRFITEALGCHNPLINDRQAIAPFELDVYIPSLKVAVEHHGLYWHSFDRPETVAEKLKHQEKWRMCTKHGIKLLQFFEHEVLQKPSLIISMLDNTTGGGSTIFDARKLSVLKTDNSTIANFFNTNHLQGHRVAKITIALVDKNNIIMAMSFSRCNDGYEIIRMATKLNCRVRGGASRLLKNFIRQYKPQTIYTYADLRHSNGNVYKQLGFKQEGITRPGYFYCKGLKTLSRQRCQKHKLHKLLDDFDPDLTEAENMFINGYRRIWDAGHLKFKLTI